MTTTQNTPGPWAIDDGMCRIEDQADFLLNDIGTEREWVCVRINDEDGFAEVVALCHPLNAPLVAAAPELLTALDALLYSAEAMKESLDGHDGYCGEPASFKQARTAIAKATKL